MKSELNNLTDIQVKIKVLYLIQNLNKLRVIQITILSTPSLYFFCKIR